MSFKCIFPDCWMNIHVQDHVPRKSGLDHITKKPLGKLVELIRQYNIVNDFSILSKWTIWNLATDLCFAGEDYQSKRRGEN